MRKSLALPALVALALFSSSSCRRTAIPPAVPAADLAATFLDVGQADAALLRTPEGHTVLIDTGKGKETADLLKRERVSRIDLMVVTHPHADHDGGMAAVLAEFPVAETWYAGKFRGRAREALRRAGAKEVAAGTRMQLGRLSLTVLHPEPGEEYEEVNNGSVVLKAVYHDHSYLFPGDCELGCWEELFRLHRPELRAQVLKAAHHGSSNGTNSGVLINVRPQTFVISCGRDNRYGHPSAIVLKLVEKLRARLLRTDKQGSIRCAGVECGQRGLGVGD